MAGKRGHRTEVIQLGTVVNMDDQGIVRRAPFCGKDGKNCLPVQSIGTETVDGLCRKGDKLSPFQEIGRKLISTCIRYQDFCLHEVSLPVH